MRKIVRCSIGLPALLAAAVAVPATASQTCAGSWRPLSAATGAIVDVPGLEQLARDFPASASVRLRLLNARLDAGDVAGSLTLADELVDGGHAFGEGAAEYLAGLGASSAWTAANSRNRVPHPASIPVDTVPKRFPLVEGLWVDPANGDMFATSVIARSLAVRRAGGEWEELPIARAGSLTGMAFDVTSGTLWIASGVFEQTPNPATAFRGVIGIDPRTGLERSRRAVPDGGNPSDLTIDAYGTVFASDPQSGAIYRTAREGPGLDILVPPNLLRSPQGLVALPGTLLLLVSDYHYGLATVARDCGGVSPVASADGAFLDGIDWIGTANDRIFGMQNGASPPRIVEVVLSANGARLFPLEVAHPEWTEPLGASLAGDRLLYIANGQWERFSAGGSEAEGPAPVETQIRSVPLWPARPQESRR